MKIEKLYSLYKQSFLVDTDTRNIRKNSMFFSLKGENFNGNTFAEKALLAGAKYSIIDEKEYQTKKNIILVDNVLETLQKLANYHRLELNIPIIGLTGSNGKTTTKELINAILIKKYNTTATLGNLNNHIGVPLTLLSMTPKTEVGIIEMGANHQKEIDFLSNISAPNFGYITNFGKAHLEGFGGIEGVIKGKSELYTYLKINNKTAIINPNDALQVSKTSKIKRIVFDESLQLLTTNPFISLKYKNVVIKTNLIGEYNFTNICAAITIGNCFKVDNSDIKNALETYVPDNNRSQIIKKGSNKVVLDAYNANPTSMMAAIKSFQLMDAKNKILILGDMFELGETKIEEHQIIADYCASIDFEQVLLVGSIFNTITTNYKQFEKFNDLSTFFKKKSFKNKTILIKGSRGMKLERVITTIS